METKENKIELVEGENSVEILQIDTVNSSELYRGLAAEKIKNLQSYLHEDFIRVCKTYGGIARSWSGDGGFAYFPRYGSGRGGNSVLAGIHILEKMIELVNQSSFQSTGCDDYRRQIRVSATKGIILIDDLNDSGRDVGEDNLLSTFLKHERKFSMTGEFCITDQLYKHIPDKLSKKFEDYKDFTISTDLFQLWRLKSEAIEHKRRVVLELGNGELKLNSGESKYLRDYIDRASYHMTARNAITSGIMNVIANENRSFQGQDVFTLTMATLNAYLAKLYTDQGSYIINIAYWRLDDTHDQLEIVDRWSSSNDVSNNSHTVSLHDKRKQVSKCAIMKEPIVCSSVRAARRRGEWVDIYDGQDDDFRELESTIQLPIYFMKRSNPTQKGYRELFGVLSIDSNKPELFLQNEVELWLDSLGGFLSNLALAEILQRH